MRMARGLFITGTDTGIGKTYTSRGIMAVLQNKALRVAGMKPVASGCMHTPEGLRNEDALLLQQQSSLELPYELINPYAFELPIAPHLAAKDQGIHIDFAHILDCYNKMARQVDVVVVEGVGGWLVPLGRDRSVADLAKYLSLPVINVVGIRLGCINHALLTHNAIQSSGVELQGWVANQMEKETEYFDEVIEGIASSANAPLLGINPFNPSAQAKDIAERFDLSHLITNL